jgi:hypothetical protein
MRKFTNSAKNIVEVDSDIKETLRVFDVGFSLLPSLAAISLTLIS